MKIESHNILLKRFFQENDFDTNSYGDYLNFHVKKFIPREDHQKRITMKFPIETQIEINISYPNFKAFKKKYY